MWKNLDEIPDVMDQLNEYKNAFLCLTTNNSTHYDKDVMDCIRRHRNAKMPSSALPFFMQLLHQIEIKNDFQDEAIKILNCLEAFLSEEVHETLSQLACMLSLKDFGRTCYRGSYSEKCS